VTAKVSSASSRSPLGRMECDESGCGDELRGERLRRAHYDIGLGTAAFVLRTTAFGLSDCDDCGWEVLRLF